MKEQVKYKEETIYDIARNGDIYSFQAINLNNIDLNKKNENGYSMLKLATCNGHRDFARYLLGLGADANSIDNTGDSILMGVAFKGHFEIAKYLIEKGADINYQNPKGQTALFFAEMAGHTEVVKLIKSYQTQDDVSLLSNLKNWASQLNFRKPFGDAGELP